MTEKEFYHHMLSSGLVFAALAVSFNPTWRFDQLAFVLGLTVFIRGARAYFTGKITKTDDKPLY